MWQIFIKNLILDIFIVNNVILIELKYLLRNNYFTINYQNIFPVRKPKSKTLQIKVKMVKFFKLNLLKKLWFLKQFSLLSICDI